MADSVPKKPKIEPTIDVTSPPPVIYHPINPPIPMIHQNVTQRQLQVQAKINDIFKPAASKKSNLQKSLIPTSGDPIIIENEPKKSTSSDIILLSSDDETEKKRQRKRLSDAANFVSSKNFVTMYQKNGVKYSLYCIDYFSPRRKNGNLMENQVQVSVI